MWKHVRENSISVNVLQELHVSDLILFAELTPFLKELCPCFIFPIPEI